MKEHKEKAQTLYNEYLSLLGINNYHKERQIEDCKVRARQCALKSINETIDCLWGMAYRGINTVKDIKYYQGIEDELKTIKDERI